MVDMNKLSNEERCAVVSALVEGNSIRSTVRMTRISKNTIVKLLADLGKACAAYHDRAVRGLRSRRVQVDEIWSFCGCKEKNVPAEMKGQLGIGDVWTFTAIDPESKLVAAWHVGKRDLEHATKFVRDLAGRLANRIQLTSDGHKMYLDAVEAGFGGQVDYAMLVKLYGSDPESEKRYSPATCIGAKPEAITGNPDSRHISTSHVERQNLTMRMSMRRFTRLTNAFSKKLENLEHAVALHFMYYNFCRIHQSLRVTPAAAAGLTTRIWEIKDLVALLP
jgi:IS1 family transposase